MRVKGIYDGDKVVLLEPLEIPPDTEVEVVVPEAEERAEAAYWKKLVELGLVTKRRTAGPRAGFPPLKVEGEPISQTIIESRR